MTDQETLSTLKLRELEKAKAIEQNSVPKIQRVAHYLRDRDQFVKHYSPRLVSFGPIHHGGKNLQPGEKYKKIWANRYLDKRDRGALYQKIASNITQLKELFADDVIKAFGDEKLSWMLFVDGCALLEVLENGNIHLPEQMGVKVDQFVLLRQDVLLLENQLPYQLLRHLSAQENGATLLKNMKAFISRNSLWHDFPPEAKNPDPAKEKGKHHGSKFAEGHTQQGKHIIEIQLEEEDPIHLLDELRRSILNIPREMEKNKKDEGSNIVTTYRSIQELRAAGIKLKKNKSHSLADIRLSYRWLCLCAELKLPQITVDDTTAPTFLNLIAYEMCPDFKNNYQICSFVVFMDSLIDHPEDVKELRSSEVLLNVLGSDEEVAKLFNTISTDLVPDSKSYLDVRTDIEKHYRNKCRGWIALGCHSYFSTPWAIIAFHAAVFALVLTFIQTWFAVHPAN